MEISDISNLILPDWPMPANIRACVTTRFAPNSQSQNSFSSDYDFFNLATHVGDHSDSVEQNRQALQKVLQLPSQPFWLSQQHTDKSICLPIDAQPTNTVLPPIADASWTQKSGVVCVVMTADCIPILLCDSHGQTVCAIHAGWQGLENQIIAKTLKSLPAGDYLAWIGPAISQKRFEVGQEVFDRFQHLPAGACTRKGFDAPECRDYESLFKPSLSEEGKYFADLPMIAQMQLEACGVQSVYLSGLCSYDDERFYSYRKACHQGDGKTGRMASLIWIES
ncbi:peptidoglycan editing factor PgeF [Thiomicrorhabdus indica]|uniref:peptidoglycan editing factor PgeF n=1 Tax=Thiomicrorhabdus indica TaxID=2267253 RepID=UPI002AA90DF7|nr:peptidoglycan editing factor PgeF [Thiomicrorhabdus indica]